MSIFRKRDGPKEKRSEPSKEMKDFIRCVDLDNQLGNFNS